MQENEEVEEQSLESADSNYVFSQAAKEKSVIGVLILGKRERFSRLEKHWELLQLINSATSRPAGSGPVWEAGENKIYPLTTPHPSRSRTLILQALCRMQRGLFLGAAARKVLPTEVLCLSSSRVKGGDESHGVVCYSQEWAGYPAQEGFSLCGAHQSAWWAMAGLESLSNQIVPQGQCKRSQWDVCWQWDV